MALQALKQFRLIYGSARSHFRRIEKSCGISGSQLWVLHEIRRAPGIGVSKLAGQLSIHQTTCSQLIDKLAAHELVVKTRSAQDQRRVGLALTPAAHRILKKAPGPAEGILPEALMRLPKNRLAALTRELQRVATELQIADPKAAHKLLADL